MVERIGKLLDFASRVEAMQDHTKEQLQQANVKAKQLVKLVQDTESARDIVTGVMLTTHEQVKEYIEGIVTLALETVYGPEYSFVLDYDIKRNQGEATPWIVKDGEKHSPREEVGGGVNDVACFALRLALWSLTSPRPAPVFVLDEPAKFLSRDKQALFGEILRELSDMLKVQIILVSHSTDIVQAADRAWEVTQKGGISLVTQLVGQGDE